MKNQAPHKFQNQDRDIQYYNYYLTLPFEDLDKQRQEEDNKKKQI